MMRDQADELRQLVRQRAVKPSHEGPGARMVVVAGGQPGVGTTTVAVNLAVALARQGRRAVLVDADLERTGQPSFPIASRHGSVVDVLAGRHTLHEVLERGPSGIQVVAGATQPLDGQQTTSSANDRFIRELRDLAPHAEVVVIDLGSARGQLAQALWRAADALVVVTTVESPAIMDAYTAVKAFTQGTLLAPLYIVVNQAAETTAAGEVHARIAEACRRFLGIETQQAPHVPTCVAGPGDGGVVFPPRGESARALDRAADTLWAQLQLGAGAAGASRRQRSA